jgi:hypothetical protein
MKVPEFTQFRESLQRAFGTRLAEDLPARVGNPVDHAILVDNTDRDGLVYIHGLGSDPQSAYTAINNLGKDALTYDAPVLVRRVVNGYIITSKDLEMWDKFWAGTVLHDQQPVLLSQIMYGTAQPTNPASMQVMLLGAIYDVDDVGYRVPDQLSANFSTSPVDVDTVAIDIPTAPLTAIGVCIQIDPTTNTISYKQGAAFPATLTHKQAFDAGYYPQRDTDQRRMTWLRLVTGMTAISYEHLYNAPELLTGGGGGVTDHGELTGLADDDHTQYALLAGRSGGQTLIGGTDASDDLTLQTTSDGTKGDYILSELTTAGPVLTSAAGVLSSEAQLALERGGTEANLSATGPGFLRQSSGGASVDVEIATPYHYRSGLQLIKQADDEIVIEAGSCVVQTSSGYPLKVINKLSSTRLALGTSGNWISGSVDEAASSWIHVYIKEDGTLRLHNQMPNECRAASGGSLYMGRVNEAGWDGSDAAHGLNATTVTYDDGAGGDPAAEASFNVGMWVSVWTDSGYTVGRGKGASAAGSVNNLSIAKVTAVDTGANTITLEAGHQIAINDNDYLTLFHPGIIHYRYVGTTHWRWLGALWNDSSSNLTNNNDHSAQYTLDEGADLSTTSTSFVDADATNLALPIISLGNDIIANFDATVGTSINSARVRLNLSVDESDVVGDDGFVSAICPTANRPVACPINRVLQTLMPGTHLFKIRLRAQTGTAYIWSGAGTGNECDVHAHFSVREVQ